MPDPDGFDRLVRDWTPCAEAWARRMDRICPGADFWPAAARAIHGAADGHDPEKGAFGPRLRWHLRNEMRGEWRTWRRRRRRLRRRDLAAAESGRIDPGFARVDALDAMPAVLAALDALPHRMADAVRRRHLGGETAADIARRWGSGPENAAKAIRHGLARLRETLDESGGRQ